MMCGNATGSFAMTISVRAGGLLSTSGFGDHVAEAYVIADGSKLRLSFKVPRGYNRYTGEDGHTRYTLWPDGESFAEIAKAMMKAHPDAAMKAFGAALSEGIPVAEKASEVA
jgi:hypothetical protein